jgi:hypothetical protein
VLIGAALMKISLMLSAFGCCTATGFRVRRRPRCPRGSRLKGLAPLFRSPPVPLHRGGQERGDLLSVLRDLALELGDARLAGLKRRLVSAEGLDEELLVSSRINEGPLTLAGERFRVTARGPIAILRDDDAVAAQKRTYCFQSKSHCE